MIDKMGKEVFTSEESELLRKCLFDYYMYGPNMDNLTLLKKLKAGFWIGVGCRSYFEEHYSSEDIHS